MTFMGDAKKESTLGGCMMAIGMFGAILTLIVESCYESTVAAYKEDVCKVIIDDLKSIVEWILPAFLVFYSLSFIPCFVSANAIGKFLMYILFGMISLFPAIFFEFYIFISW